MGEILVGTSSWSDPELIASKKFFPEMVKTAEARLAYYATQFHLVEVDSSYYALPSEKVSQLWVKRTPDQFTFDIKTFRLFTNHPTPLKSLPKDIREAVPEEKKKTTNLYYRDLPEELIDGLWGRFASALVPLQSSKKLGTILFQFPPWFFPGRDSQQHILTCQEKLADYRLAIEFRNNTWMSEKNAMRTADFLRQSKLAFVCVDEPQGFKTSVPALDLVTSDVGVVRFHGRNYETWNKKGATTDERFSYLYSKEELESWIPRIKNLAAKTRELHVLFNNHFEDNPIVNARQLKMMLGV